ncbi:Hsp70 family protein [Rhizobium sp. LjRoot254]|uniref:Hsp70 family protein n=1 Tax=Rhizobium sp. LjRoot254 TaxID=3342297 RepID=UPI003ECF6553
MAILGIDLGTTNSLIGVFEDGKARLVRNAHDSFLTPSAVAVNKAGEIVVGAGAREMALVDPDNAVMSFKRWMGSDRVVKLGTKSYRAEDLSSFVLRSLVDDFQARHGGTVEEVVISCPAYFNDMQRKATIHAAQLAGLKVERLVNEPTAAVLAYGLEAQEEGQFLVFDLGGGTFDVSVMHKYDGVFEIRASAGDNFLGGDDFTDTLARLLCRKSKVDTATLSNIDLARLIRAAEAVKAELSARPGVDYRIALSSSTLEGNVTREEFETECVDLFRRLRQPLERALRDSTIAPDELDAVVLVGGATRMPAIRQMVARLFGKLPFVNINPDEVVAQGAVIRAALKARSAAVEDVLLTDVCPFTLGIGISRERPDGRREDVVSPIIQRNATVPISRVESYTTVENNQSMIDLRVFQGENLKPEHNVMIGSLMVKVPPGPAGKQSVDVRFTYDLNGALEVEATVTSTMQVFKAVFANSSGMSEVELSKRFAELAAIKLAPRDQAENKALIARAERLYAEALDEERETIADGLLQFNAVIDDQREANLDRARREFREFLDRFDRFVFTQS